MILKKIFAGKNSMLQNAGMLAGLIVVSLLFAVPQSAIKHTKTNFYKKLEMGLSPKIVVVGTSVSASHWGNWWPIRLVDTLNARFQYRVSYANYGLPGSNDAYLYDAADHYIVPEKPDLVIYEVCTGVPSANVITNLRSVIRLTHVNMPGADILFWCPWPTPNHTNEPPSISYDTCAPFKSVAKQIASDSGIYWVDTWSIMDSIYRADPSPTCFANRNLNTYSCPLYSTYLFDGYHPSIMCGDSIILPWMLKTMRGLDLIDTNVVAEPEFTPYPGEYTTAQTVNIRCSTPGATICYTTDGSTPTTSSTVYSSALPITIGQSTTLKVLAFKIGKTTSSVASVRYSIKAQPPIFSPYPSGYTTVPTPVTLSCATPNSTIRYTTDGSEPTTTHGTIYSSAIPVSSATFIKATAYTTTLEKSKTVSGLYFISDSVYTDTNTYKTAMRPSGGNGVQTALIPCMFSPSSVWNKMVVEFDCHISTGPVIPVYQAGYLTFTLFDQGPLVASGGFPMHCISIGSYGQSNHGYFDCGWTRVHDATVWKFVGFNNGKSFFHPKPLPYLSSGFDASYKIEFTRLTSGKVELSHKIIKAQEVWGPIVDTISADQWRKVDSAKGRNLSGVLQTDEGIQLSIKNIRVSRMRDTLHIAVQKAVSAPSAVLSGTTQHATAYVVRIGEPGAHSVVLYDVTGRVVFSAKGTGNRQYTIPRKSIGNGVYLVQIKTKNKLSVERLCF